MNNRYIDGMNEIRADEEFRRKIVSRIMQGSSKHILHFFTLKKAAAVAAIACVFALVMSFGIPFVQNDSHTTKQGHNEVHSLFDGFVITAYAQDGTSVDVKPNVEFTLGKYRLTMSSVPGFPVKIACDGADTIKLTVTDGVFLLWTPPASKVINKGTEMEIKSGGTIYWSPISGISSDDIATNCTIMIEAYKNDEKLGSNKINIKSDDNYTYSGRLSE